MSLALNVDLRPPMHQKACCALCQRSKSVERFPGVFTLSCSRNGTDTPARHCCVGFYPVHGYEHLPRLEAFVCVWNSGVKQNGGGTC